MSGIIGDNTGRGTGLIKATSVDVSRTLLNTATTSSSANVTIDGHFANTDYKKFIIEIDHMDPASNAVYVRTVFRGGDPVADLTASNYWHVLHGVYRTSGHGATSSGGNNAAYADLTQGFEANAANAGYGTVIIHNAQSTSIHKVVESYWPAWGDSDEWTHRYSAATYETAASTPMLGIKFYLSSGNFEDGVVFRTYGQR